MGFFEDHAGDARVLKWALVKISFASPYSPLYLTDCDVSIEYDGHTWEASGVTLGSVSTAPDGQSATFAIPDADGALFTLLAATNGAESVPVTISEAGFLTTNVTPTPDAVRSVFNGRVDTSSKDCSGGRDVVEFSCMPAALVDAAYLPQKLISTLVRIT